jgi:hypothetical protein
LPGGKRGMHTSTTGYHNRHNYRELRNYQVFTLPSLVPPVLVPVPVPISYSAVLLASTSTRLLASTTWLATVASSGTAPQHSAHAHTRVRTLWMCRTFSLRERRSLFAAAAAGGARRCQDAAQLVHRSHFLRSRNCNSRWFSRKAASNIGAQVSSKGASS